MATLLSINNYHYRRDGGDIFYLEHNNRLFEKSGWNVVPFSMYHSENIDSRWSKYFIPTDIEYGQSYSIWRKVVRVPKGVYSFEALKMLAKVLNSLRVDVVIATPYTTVYLHLFLVF